MTERLPAGLRDALSERGAEISRVIEDPPRNSAFASGPTGDLFAWWSDDPDDAAVLEHEVEVRRRITGRWPLGAPPILARGMNWRLEPAMVPASIEGRAVDHLVEAMGVVAGLDLPSPPEHRRSSAAVSGSDHRPQPRMARARRLLRYARAGLRPTDLIHARRLMDGPGLPRVAAHGDLRASHVFPVSSGVMIIDWETVGTRPAGWDLLFFWASMAPGPDRDRLFELTVRSVGEEHRDALLRLRFAAAVLMIVGMVGEPQRRFRDFDAARRLVRELPAYRRDAAGG